MCFSAEASIRSLITGLLGSVLCVSLGQIPDKIIGYFLGFVSLMQGIDYLLWTHQKCDLYNRVITILGMLLNHLQPFVIGVVVLAVNPHNKDNNLIKLLMLIYLIVIIPYSYTFIQMKGGCSLKGENHKHIVWQWNKLPFTQIRYFTFLSTMTAILILGTPNKALGIVFAVSGLFMYITSLIVYPKEVAGALWCYYTAYVPIVYYLVRKLIPFSTELVNLT